MANDNDSNKNFSDSIKKLLTVGLGAAFMTEEHIRSYVSEMKIPKDVLGALLQGAGKSKEELLQRVGGELMKMVSKIDLVKEASRFAEEHKFKITAEVEVMKKAPSREDTEES